MSKHENPMQFFKGTKLGVNLKLGAVEDLLQILSTLIENEKRINAAMEHTFGESRDEYDFEAVYAIEACLHELPEMKDRLQIAASSTLADDIALSLEKFSILSDETRAQALRIALGQIVFEDD